MKPTKITNALRNNQTLYPNESKVIFRDNENGTTTMGEMLNVTSRPIEVVVKKPNSYKFQSNFTHTGVLGMRSGDDVNNVGKKEKTTEKGKRKKRRALREVYGGEFGYDYPSSKEIPKIKSGEIPSKLYEEARTLLEFDPFDVDFNKALPGHFPHKLHRDNLPKSFISSTFFSNEDFIHTPITHIYSNENSAALSKENEGEVFSEEENVSKSKGPASKDDEDDYTDEKDAYDIHGFRGGDIEDRSTGPKPPAYSLAQRAHDFTPTRLNSNMPIVFPQRNVNPVTTFRTHVIHNFPGLALPGAGDMDMPKGPAGLGINEVKHMDIDTMKVNMKNMPVKTSDNNSNANKSENSDDDDDDDSEEHHHHHFYDQLRHVHINPPKGFDPDSFRLTLPHFIKKGKYTGKKHKHFHHIENAPVIIKYEDTNQKESSSTKKPKSTSNKKPPKDRPMTESEEEAMYDEEGEISEKEIENAYKNYDDSGITKDIVHDYEIESEESKVEMVRHEDENRRSLQNRNDKVEAVNKISKNFSRLFNNNKVSSKPKSFSNFWKTDYRVK